METYVVGYGGSAVHIILTGLVSTTKIYCA